MTKQESIREVTTTKEVIKMPSLWIDEKPLQNLAIDCLLNLRKYSLRADTTLRNMKNLYVFHWRLQHLRL